MRSFAVALALVAAGTPAVLAAPLVPRIIGHDFNFGAWEPEPNVPADPWFYDPRGAEPDHLTLAGDSSDREATAFWKDWPVGGIPAPIFNALDEFGGDFELYLEFDGEDAQPPFLEVSITGKGRNVGADLIISGKMPDHGIFDYEVLIAIDVLEASLYGYGDESSFVLETVGEFLYVNPLLPDADELIGDMAVSRGNIDYLDLELPIGYDPLLDYGLGGDGGGYSGEVGWGFPTPEPASLLALLIGAVALLPRRRTHRR